MARPSRLSRFSVADLRAELARRQSRAGALQRRHDQLAAEVESVRAELEALGADAGSAPRAGRRGRRGGRRAPGRPRGGARRGRRPRNKATLVEALAALLKGKTMRVSEAADAVRAAGYRTGSRNFRTMVNIALVKGPFKRQGRGRYTAR